MTVEPWVALCQVDGDLLMNVKDVQGSVVRGAEKVMMALQARVCPAYQAGPHVFAVLVC